jgi:hypothetical protein
MKAEGLRMNVKLKTRTSFAFRAIRLYAVLLKMTAEQALGRAKSTINEHIKNIFAKKELIESLLMQKFGNSEFVCRKFRRTTHRRAMDG